MSRIVNWINNIERKYIERKLDHLMLTMASPEVYAEYLIIKE